MAKTIRTRVTFAVTMDIEHPEDYSTYTIRLCARGALRNALLDVENSTHGFDQHPLRMDEAVCVTLDEVEFEF